MIQRQIVEVALAKKENAWQLQQELSHILQKRLPPLLDRCLSDASSPDWLYRIDHLELDLGTLDPGRLSDDLMEKIEQSLRLALSEQLVSRQSHETGSKNDPKQSHLELFGYFVRHGYLPWWADNSQRQLPEKSCMALLQHDPAGLKHLLLALIREPRSLQRLTGYFDEVHLTAIGTLLTGAPNASVTALWAVLTELHSLIFQYIQSKSTLWQSLLQVAAAGEPPISRRTEFFAAIIARWFKLQNLPGHLLSERCRQLRLTPALTGNEWLPAVESMDIGIASELSGKFDEHNQVQRDNSDYPASEKKANDKNDAYRIDLSGGKNSIRANSRRSSAVVSGGESLSTDIIASAKAEEFSERGQAWDENLDSSVASLSAGRSYAYSIETSAIVSRYLALGKRRLAVDATPEKLPSNCEAVDELASQTGSNLNCTAQVETGPDEFWQKAVVDVPGLFEVSNETNNKVLQELGAQFGSVTKPMSKAATNALRSIDESGFKDVHNDSVKINIPFVQVDESSASPSPETMLTSLRRFAQAPISRRYAVLKQDVAVHAGPVKQTLPPPMADATGYPLAELRPTENSYMQQDRQIESTAFSETDTVYINNAGLCLLWPYLTGFFERLQLVQNGRFRDREAQQCAVSLLHYAAFAELDPPEYLLAFNKLLCGVAVDDVFENIPLTSAQTAACDELLEAVVANAPILNNMSINGFRGSFLLRQGSISAGEGSWLLRVERETYDLVLERFPWSWQWLKLPWMEYPVRVEW